MLDEKWKAGFSKFRDRFEEDVFIQLNIHLSLVGTGSPVPARKGL
jgi:hypothetical protein